MARIITFLLWLFVTSASMAQTYFPPKSFNDKWDTVSHQDAGFCQQGIDSLYSYLERSHSRSFIVLIDGKIALEKYFGTYTKDSVWYYASAGKSVMSFLLGVAQQEGDLDIDSPSRAYLGNGWTSCTDVQEKAITVRHQMAMSTGLDDREDFNCMDPSCLKYRTDPYDRWFYFNGPYRLTQDVLENATGLSKNTYSLFVLNPIGWWGLWYDYILYGRARDMARFGHLVLNRGVWNGDSILKDQEIYDEMVNSSNALNPAYGLLWWLNGKDKFILPGTAISFNGSLVPDAPDDMFAAMGKDDQRIYVIPGKKMVIVRQGEASGISLYAKSGFDDQLWHYLNGLDCSAGVKEQERSFKIYPNPVSGTLHVESPVHINRMELYTLTGEKFLESSSSLMPMEAVPAGMYFIRIYSASGISTRKIIVQH